MGPPAVAEVETLAAAARTYQPGTRPLELAGACEDAGAALARHSHPDRAHPLLEQALALYERLDADRDLARAEAVLRQAGPRRGPRGRPASDWASLTPAERAVAGLVADGLTNRQIGERLYISRRTVQTHLVHVFAKLGIASRAQLAAQVTHHRRQEPPPAQATPAEDSALTDEPARGVYLPGSVLSPAAGRRKQRFTARPRSACADDGIRRMADVPCRPEAAG